MNAHAKSLCRIAAMIGVALAGIFQLIDQSSMIVLTIVLLVTGRGSLGSCPLPWRRV